MMVRLHQFRVVFVLGTLGVVFLHTFISGQVGTMLHPMLQPLVLGGGILLLVAALLYLALLPEVAPIQVPAPKLRNWKHPVRDLIIGSGLVAYAFISAHLNPPLQPWLQPLGLIGGLLLLGAALLYLAGLPGISDKVSPLLHRWKNGARDLAVAAAMVTAVCLAPHSFSSLALANRTTIDPTAALRGKDLGGDAPAFHPDAQGSIKLEVTDLLMAAEHAETVQQLEGQKVRFIGQFMPVDAHHFKMIRFLMFCCAADVQPISVTVDGDGPASAKMSWTEVTGTVHFTEPLPGKIEPHVTLETIKAIPEPANQFLY